MCLYFESIRVVNGSVMNLDYHRQRMNVTTRSYGGMIIDLKGFIYRNRPVEKQGVYKLRIQYNAAMGIINKWDYLVYNEKPIETLRLVSMPEIQYKFKSENRLLLDQAYAQRNGCDDVLIVQNNLITDTWYCNVAFFDGDYWLTPKNCLLQGTMREKLLNQNKIKLAIIGVKDLRHFSKVRLINAMIPWSNYKDILIKNIY